MIPDFHAEELPAIKNNTTIFIQRADYNGNAIKIPRRTISFLSEKLRNNGCDDSYKLLRKTQGLYYYLKTELFTGKLSHPRWENDNNMAAMCSHKSIINLQIINRFFELAQSIIADVDPLFNEPFDRHYLLSAIRKQRYSNSIKTGLIHSLILLAVCADCQGKVNTVVKDVLSKISTVNDWAYIAIYRITW